MIFRTTILLLMFLSIFPLEAKGLFVEGKCAHFYPKDKIFRDIYSVREVLHSVEIGYNIKPSVDIWGSGGRFHDKGFSLEERDPTEITFVPLGIGFKYLYPFCFGDFYVGAGMLYSYLHMNDDSIYVHHSKSKWTPGEIVKVGALLKIYQGLHVDLFSEYSFTKLNFHDTDGGRIIGRRVDLSGLSLGVGIGMCFGTLVKPVKHQYHSH